jgi:hypothetical protein
VSDAGKHSYEEDESKFATDREAKPLSEEDQAEEDKANADS